MRVLVDCGKENKPTVNNVGIEVLIRIQWFKFNIYSPLQFWQQHLGKSKTCFPSPGLVAQGIIVISKTLFCRKKKMHFITCEYIYLVVFSF